MTVESMMEANGFRHRLKCGKIKVNNEGNLLFYVGFIKQCCITQVVCHHYGRIQGRKI